ncbi:c-type cytochrome, partial [Pseudomonas aeruginosa]|uniref:c-type cytochrome n=1 Tax=Pseudomonas aeruginosa TaxID=287 RepID=UPI000EC7FD71|nr:hypothetical protein [Pseudomonas aeruginosa]
MLALVFFATTLNYIDRAAQGLAALKAPRLAGQWAEYLATQLHGFRDGKRGNSATMRAVAGGLEDSDIQALAGYLGSLGP